MPNASASHQLGWIPKLSGPSDWRSDLVTLVIGSHMNKGNEISNEMNFYDYVLRRCHLKHWFDTVLQGSKPMEYTLTKKAILAIDNRPNPLTVFAIMQTLSCLRVEEWSSVIVFTKASAAPYYTENLAGLKEILGLEIIYNDVPYLSREPFNIEDYNELMTSTFVWETLSDKGYETVLLVQDDGFLVRPGLDDAYELFEYGYVGAPWIDVPANAYLKSATQGRLCGNGGLSLRKVQTMLQVARERPRSLFFNEIQTEPEDVYFAIGSLGQDYHKGLCPHTLAIKFSSEQILTESFGIHKPWAFHEPQVIKRYLSEILRS